MYFFCIFDLHLHVSEVLHSNRGCNSTWQLEILVTALTLLNNVQIFSYFNQRNHYHDFSQMDVLLCAVRPTKSTA